MSSYTCSLSVLLIQASCIVRSNTAYLARDLLLCKFQKEAHMKNIFVGNLSFGTTEDTVRSMFETYGTVDRVNLVTDRDTGRARGFGFVEMAVGQEADRAIAGLNGREVDGRALSVNEARPKGDRAGGYRAAGQNRRW